MSGQLPVSSFSLVHFACVAPTQKVGMGEPIRALSVAITFLLLRADVVHDQAAMAMQPGNRDENCYHVNLPGGLDRLGM